ncbi:protein-L-isoaspartate(D-aspartate) O-methyltransferase [Sphingomonas sp.]|uniref:protein-L-isoaspartate(D-aspartate) O-methyltransferase n=1 Tax=Sphingomonas sp. TaxID=28214 RepID=UPI00286C9C25|nr:protein-L-isoaspartate(D-aspartate) O-methyltransferase [Sphingomonas sp.]
MPDFEELRERMVERQIAARGIRDPRLLDALRQVPREVFVASDYGIQAYGDHPLPIAAGQTISQPYIVALMIEAAGIGPSDRVLEVGAGSGYAAAVMGLVAAQVIAIECQPELVAAARERMERIDYGNVAIVEGDGTRGWPEGAPYDAILVAAAGGQIPQSLIDQLAPGGRLVMPVGGRAWVQQLVKLTKLADGRTNRENLGEVRFVPLIGEEGWSDNR